MPAKPKAKPPRDIALPANRRGNPNWVKGGASPNPQGRGLEAYRLGDLARAHTPEAIETLAAIMKDPKQPGATRVSAATALMDRAHGRPSISVEATIETRDAGMDHLDALRAWSTAAVVDVTPEAQ